MRRDYRCGEISFVTVCFVLPFRGTPSTRPSTRRHEPLVVCFLKDLRLSLEGKTEATTETSTCPRPKGTTTPRIHHDCCDSCSIVRRRTQQQPCLLLCIATFMI